MHSLEDVGTVRWITTPDVIPQQRELNRLYPTSQSIQGIRWICYKACFGLRGVLMNGLNRLRKRTEMTRDRSDTCPDQNTVESMLLEFCGHNRLSPLCQER